MNIWLKLGQCIYVLLFALNNKIPILVFHWREFISPNAKVPGAFFWMQTYQCAFLPVHEANLHLSWSLLQGCVSLWLVCYAAAFFVTPHSAAASAHWCIPPPASSHPRPALSPHPHPTLPHWLGAWTSVSIQITSSPLCSAFFSPHSLPLLFLASVHNVFFDPLGLWL